MIPTPDDNRRFVDVVNYIAYNNYFQGASENTFELNVNAMRVEVMDYCNTFSI